MSGRCVLAGARFCCGRRLIINAVSIQKRETRRETTQMKSHVCHAQTTMRRMIRVRRNLSRLNYDTK